MFRARTMETFELVKIYVTVDGVSYWAIFEVPRAEGSAFVDEWCFSRLGSLPASKQVHVATGLGAVALAVLWAWPLPARALGLEVTQPDLTSEAHQKIELAAQAFAPVHHRELGADHLGFFPEVGHGQT